MESQEMATRKPARTVLVSVFVILLAFTVVLVGLSIPAGIYSVFSGHLSHVYNYLSLVHVYFWIGPAIANVPVQVSVGAWFLILTGIYVAFMLYALSQNEGPLKAIARSFTEGFGALTSSPFLVAIISIGFLTFTASIIDQAVSSSGVPIGNPSGDPLSLLVGLTASPLVEELGFRVLLIGVVALILSIGRPWKTALAALWRPSRAIEGLAVGGGASMIIWAATGFSAATFGACHVLCGNTWDIGKFPEAAYGGFVLGYLYVRYGFHVAVLAHWGVDFFGSVYSFFGQAAYGVAWNTSTNEFLGQYLVDIDMLLLFGLASFLVVMYLGARRLANRGSKMTGEFDKGPPERGQAEP